MRDREVLFSNYKIDYAQPLGAGNYGAVYKVVNRPANESSLAYWFPYIYDRIFPTNNSMQTSADYCVKIHYPLIYCFWNTFQNCIFSSNWDAAKYAYTETKKAAKEPIIEKGTNELLNTYGLSQLSFFKSNNIYAQFKTLVRGHTFSFYLNNNYFTNREQFEFRKAFVGFLRELNKHELVFIDVHRNNLMYDEVKKGWEIIDGVVLNKADNHLQKKTDSITNFLKGLVDEDDYVFEKLAYAARNFEGYTEHFDQFILSAFNSRMRQQQ